MQQKVSTAPPITAVSDATSLLWRYLVYGHPVPQQIWDDAAAHTERAFPTAGVAFADVHVDLAVPRSCNRTTQFTRPPAARSSRPRRP